MLVFAFLAPPPAALARQYKIATVAWAGWSPLHVAAAKGFWKRLGLSVRVINYDNSIIMQEAIKAGRVDFSMEMAGSIVGIHMVKPGVVMLAETNWSHGGDQVIVRKGKLLGDIIGQPLGVYLAQPSCLYFLGQYLKIHHLKLDQFRIVEIGAPDLTAQFVARRLDAIVQYEPWASQALSHGAGVTLATSAQFPGSIPECLWAYREALGKIPGDDVVAILRGWVAAARWVNRPENWEEFKTILNRDTFKGLPPQTDEQLRAMMHNVSIHSPQKLAERNRDGGGLIGYLQDLKAFLAENRLLQKDFSPREIFDNHFVLNALALETQRDPRP